MDQKRMNELFVWNKKASRLELFVRIFYSIPVAIVLSLYSFLMTFCFLLQLPFILVLGRRLEILNKVVKGYLEYYTQIAGYFYMTTDERPGILPKDISIFEKQLYYDHNTVEIFDRDEK
ncbi:DUF4389 domain-containing protein [Methanococcoides alaskense]|uniref:Cellulose synthase/poly-beta-1,6-N-acetylglucosamine synthase-like glycosyltransferase n=1 Tax=Methanococcoides alaskense TaxID=325778 RepID=A0AA90U1F5_9EURY|nr:DUF4389 domain-containing protein [Methanococcoides alaskense]MDR6223558.1 cellulose synthase/poly-beta-1,6-N-acetylglucosamine synthase-like glycosyltransferase [Methanococcoides alaskense]